MSTKAQAILDEIRALPLAEWHELCQQVTRMTGQTDRLPSPLARVSDEEFQVALDEVTGCTAQTGSLARLLEDRRRDRERDEAWLMSRHREKCREI